MQLRQDRHQQGLAACRSRPEQLSPPHSSRRLRVLPAKGASTALVRLISRSPKEPCCVTSRSEHSDVPPTPCNCEPPEPPPETNCLCLATHIIIITAIAPSTSGDRAACSGIRTDLSRGWSTTPPVPVPGSGFWRGSGIRMTLGRGSGNQLSTESGQGQGSRSRRVSGRRNTTRTVRRLPQGPPEAE